MFDEKQGKKWNQTSSWWVTFSGRDTKVDDSNPVFSWPHWDQQMQIAAYPLMMLVDILEFWFVLSLCHGPGFWIHSFQLQTLKSCLYLTFWFSVSLFINLWVFVSVFGCFQQVQLLFCILSCCFLILLCVRSVSFVSLSLLSPIVTFCFILIVVCHCALFCVLLLLSHHPWFVPAPPVSSYLSTFCVYCLSFPSFLVGHVLPGVFSP